MWRRSRCGEDSEHGSPRSLSLQKERAEERPFEFLKEWLPAERAAKLRPSYTAGTAGSSWALYTSTQPKMVVLFHGLSCLPTCALIGRRSSWRAMRSGDIRTSFRLSCCGLPVSNLRNTWLLKTPGSLNTGYIEGSTAERTMALFPQAVCVAAVCI